jgi:hypothetical protein
MPNSLTWWIADFVLLFLVWMLAVQAYRGAQPRQHVAIARRAPEYDRALFNVQSHEEYSASSTRHRERG